jgi:hypothetical protein
MTYISRPVTRETAVLYHRRPLVVTIEPRCVTIREKGRRDRVSLSFDVIYEFALRRRFMEREKEKRAARAAGKKRG